MIFSKDCYLKADCYRCNVAKKECEPFCQKLFKIDALLTNAMLTEKQKRNKIVLLKSGQDISAQSRLVKYVKDITNWVQQGNNLYIHSSNCGNGKTAWSIKFIQEYVKAIWAKADVEDCRALFVSVPKFLIESKRSIGEFSEYADTVKKRVANADLVVWDEIGSKAGTEYEIEILLNIINDRINNGKANIYTSNLPEDTLRVCLGERLYSRIVNLSDVCEFKNNDLRGKFKK
jgi:DNA replication protein DnaC